MMNLDTTTQAREMTTGPSAQTTSNPLPANADKDITYNTITEAVAHMPIGVDQEAHGLYLEADSGEVTVIVQFDDTDTIVTVFNRHMAQTAQARFSGLTSVAVVTATVVAYLS